MLYLILAGRAKKLIRELIVELFQGVAITDAAAMRTRDVDDGTRYAGTGGDSEGGRIEDSLC